MFQHDKYGSLRVPLYIPFFFLHSFVLSTFSRFFFSQFLIMKLSTSIPVALVVLASTLNQLTSAQTTTSSCPAQNV